MILVDLSVWVNYFNGIHNTATDILDNLLGKEMIITGDIILLEVLQGFKSEKAYKKGKDLFDLLPCYHLTNRELAIYAADKYRFLRKKGITINKIIDLIIACFCISIDIPLLHEDKDFMVFENEYGLKSYSSLI